MHLKSLKEPGESMDGRSEALAPDGPALKPYEPPVLIRYGSLAALTANGVQELSDDPAVFSGPLA
jgi:hypothetical protein